MPYNNFGEYYSTRRIGELSTDPFRESAERLTKNIEEYLYDTNSKFYMDPFFLAWSIEQYDLSKQGSGRVFDSITYDSADRSIVFQAPPVPYPGKSGSAEYRVDNGDGTYQVVSSPDNKDRHWPKLP